MEMTPSIGRIVHYKHTSGQVCPALIISVKDNRNCALQIFRENESYVNPDTPFDNGERADGENIDSKPGTWSWPPRV